MRGKRRKKKREAEKRREKEEDRGIDRERERERVGGGGRETMGRRNQSHANFNQLGLSRFRQRGKKQLLHHVIHYGRKKSHHCMHYEIAYICKHIYINLYTYIYIHMYKFTYVKIFIRT